MFCGAWFEVTAMNIAEQGVIRTPKPFIRHHLGTDDTGARGLAAGHSQRRLPRAATGDPIGDQRHSPKGETL